MGKNKIILPDGTPANKRPSIVGAHGETLSGELPANAPKAIIMTVMFENKLSQEVEYSGAAIVPLKNFVEVAKKGDTAVEAFYMEVFLQIFITELKTMSPEKLTELETARDVYNYMVTNYSLKALPIMGVNTILTLNFEEDDADNASVSSEDASEQS